MAGIAYVRPVGESKYLWRCRVEGVTHDYPAPDFDSLDDFEIHARKSHMQHYQEVGAHHD
jgi:hypothetical protein